MADGPPMHQGTVPSGMPRTCEASDCAKQLPPHRNCAMCHKDFCHRCTSAGFFCHECLQYTFLTREPPLPDPVRTAELIAPDSLAPLLRHIEQLKRELAQSQEMVRKMQQEYGVANSAMRPASGETPSPMVIDTHSAMPNGNSESAFRPPVLADTSQSVSIQGIGLQGGAHQMANLLDGDFAVQSKIFLREQELTEFDASLIAQYLKSNSSVTLMDLSDNSIGNRGTASIAESLRHHSSVKRLVLYNNGIEDAGAISISEMLVHNQTLTIVELSENSVMDAGVTAIANALRTNRSLTDLGLSVNAIGDPGASALAECLRVNSSLKVLALDSNHIGNSGVRALASAISQNNSLTEVNLSTNAFDDDGRALLRQVASNTRSNLTLKF